MIVSSREESLDQTTLGLLGQISCSPLCLFSKEIICLFLGIIIDIPSFLILYVCGLLPCLERHASHYLLGFHAVPSLALSVDEPEVWSCHSAQRTGFPNFLDV